MELSIPILIDTCDNTPDFDKQTNKHHSYLIHVGYDYTYNNYSNRLKTFGDRKFHITNEALAASGFHFIYDNFDGSYIKCGACGLMLNVNNIVNIWLRHINMSCSTCPYILSYIKSLENVNRNTSENVSEDTIIHNESIPDNILCIICYSAQRNKIFQPCGHLVTCENCAKKVKDTTNQCCICKVEITDIFNAIIS